MEMDVTHTLLEKASIQYDRSMTDANHSWERTTRPENQSAESWHMTGKSLNENKRAEKHTEEAQSKGRYSLVSQRKGVSVMKDVASNVINFVKKKKKKKSKKLAWLYYLVPARSGRSSFWHLHYFVPPSLTPFCVYVKWRLLLCHHAGLWATEIRDITTNTARSPSFPVRSSQLHGPMTRHLTTNCIMAITGSCCDHVFMIPIIVFIHLQESSCVKLILASYFHIIFHSLQLYRPVLLSYMSVCAAGV